MSRNSENRPTSVNYWRSVARQKKDGHRKTEKGSQTALTTKALGDSRHCLEADSGCPPPLMEQRISHRLVFLQRYSFFLFYSVYQNVFTAFVMRRYFIDIQRSHSKRGLDNI
jgi:hypothetical protein